jgi:hypothetical protein
MAITYPSVIQEEEMPSTKAEIYGLKGGFNG